MKKSLKRFVVVGAMGVLLPGSLIFAQSATTSPSALEDIINQLQAQIKTLEREVTKLQYELTAVKVELKFTKALARGASGEEVEELQEFLKTFPEIYPEGLVTGYFGPLTEAAVKRFQEKNKIESVGIVGPKTLSKLNELVTEGAGESGKIPPGLLRAPGLEGRIATATPSPLPSPSITPPPLAPTPPAKPCAGVLEVPSKYPTIQDALGAVCVGGTIKIAVGTYTSTIQLRSNHSGIKIKGEGIDKTILKGSASTALFIDDLSDVAIEDLTIREGGNKAIDGGGVRILRSRNITLSNCRITANRGYQGGGIAIDNNSSVAIYKCVIDQNTADNAGGGVVVRYGSSATLQNVTIANNKALSCLGIGLSAESSNVVFKNSIVWGNTDMQGTNEQGLKACPRTTALYGASGISYSDTQGGALGTGNINADPLFVSGATGDFHLSASSPAINAGDPSTFDPDGSRADMGAYPFVPPPPPPATLIQTPPTLIATSTATSTQPVPPPATAPPSATPAPPPPPPAPAPPSTTSTTTTTTATTTTATTTAPSSGQFSAPSWSKSVWTGSEYGIVWSREDRTGETEIFFTRTTSGGIKIGNDLTVSTNHSTADTNYAIAWNGSNYGIIYEDYWGNVPLHSNSYTSYSTYFSIISGQGQKIGGDIKIATGGQYIGMHLFWTGSDYTLIYINYRPNEIRFRKFSSDGQPLGSIKTIDSEPTKEIDTLSVVWTGTEYVLSVNYLAAFGGGGSKSLRLSASGDLIILTPPPPPPPPSSTATTTTATTTSSTPPPPPPPPPPPSAASIKTGTGTVGDSKTFSFGTGNVFYSVGGTGVSGYIYSGLSTSPTLYFANPTPSDTTACGPYPSSPSYQGVTSICQFTSATNYTFSGAEGSVRIYDKSSPCYQGILLFRQNNLYGGIDPEDVDGSGSLHYRYWYDESGGSNFSSLCASSNYIPNRTNLANVLETLSNILKILKYLQNSVIIRP